jgi:hypothetical protein
MPDEEFQINDLLTVRLEGDKTVLYVAGERFRQCIRLMLQIPLDHVDDFDGVNSIDEAHDTYKTLLEGRVHEGGEHEVQILPEEEYRAHCSNLHAWALNDYDTRLLAANLAFPLLKALADAGDGQARKMFRDEVAERYATGTKNVRRFLIDKGFLASFTREEVLQLELHPDEYETIRLIAKQGGWTVPKLVIGLKEEGGRVVELRPGPRTKPDPLPDAPPKALTELEHLTHLNLMGHGFKELPDWIGEMPSLTYLNLNNNEIEELPEGIGNLTFLHTVLLYDNNLKTLPRSLGDLSSLSTLAIGRNQLTDLPNMFRDLRSLRSLDLRSNQLTEVPEVLRELPRRIRLNVTKNPLEGLPSWIYQGEHVGRIEIDSKLYAKIKDEIPKEKKIGINIRYPDTTLKKI